MIQHVNFVCSKNSHKQLHSVPHDQIDVGSYLKAWRKLHGNTEGCHDICESQPPGTVTMNF